MPKVSVIIPVYNVEKYVKQSLDSVVNQTLKDIEIICVDDCGTDASMEIVSQFAKNDSRIKIIKHTKNGGLSTARNTGLKSSTAPYIMFLDSDDYYESDMCEKMLNAIETSDSDIAICGTNVIYESNEEWKQSDDEYYKIKFNNKQNITENILFNTDVSAWNKIYRKNIIDTHQICFPDGLKYEDAYFFNTYMSQAKSAFFINEKLYNYRRREGSIMNETFNKKNSDSIHHLKIAILLYEYYKNHNLIENKYEYFANLFLSYYDFAMFHASSKDDKKQIKQLAASFAKKNLIDTKILPFDVARKIETIKNDTASSRHFLIKLKETSQSKKFYVLGIPIYKIKYKKSHSKHYLLGILIYKSSMRKKVKINISSSNFCPFNLDNSTLLAKLKSLKNFTYIPNPGNMGDMLIAAATLQFFDKNNLPYTMINNSQNFDTVVYGGGGIWTNDYENAWIKFLPYFKQAKKILILPSSFHNCRKFIEQLDERFIVFCREKQSYDYLTNQNTKAEILLDHDMAFRLDASIFHIKNFNLNYDDIRIIQKLKHGYKKLSSIGLFLREDCESIHNYPTDLDLSSLCYGSEMSTKEYIMFCALIMLCAVDSVNAVVTDRLHVGIAGVLMGKETYLLDNSYKKISNVFKQTLSQNKSAHLVDTILENLNPKQTASDNLERLFKAIL